MRNSDNFWSEILKERDHLNDLEVNRRMSDWFIKVWTGFIWLRIGTRCRLL